MSNYRWVVGNLGANPLYKEQGPNSSLIFTVYDNDQENSIAFRCAIYGERAVTLFPHFATGRRVSIRGEERKSVYGERNEKEVISTRVDELRFLDRKADGSAEQEKQKGGSEGLDIF